jgi:Fe2+ transport system protein B
MFDMTERSRLEIDVDQLSKSLGVAVVPVVAKPNRGITELPRATRNVIIAGAICRLRAVCAELAPFNL